MKCWGHLLPGEAGSSCALNEVSCAPAFVPGLTGVKQLSLNSHACAVLTDGTVWCWGNNDYGQVGNGEPPTTPTSTPSMVPGLTDVVEVATAARSTCARSSSGTVSCWGVFDNVFSTPVHKTPTPVPGVTGAVQLVMGDSHRCARFQDGTVKCWGLNGSGQLPINPGQDVDVTEVAGLTDVVQLAAGGSHTCALRADASVVCWGYNGGLQLGNASSDHTVPTPVDW